MIGVTLIASLALLLGHQPMVHELPRAERVTGRTVFCLSPQAFNQYATNYGKHEVGGGFWDIDDQVIILDAFGTCFALAHPAYWLPRNPEQVAMAVFLLGHEAAHARQQDLGLPFNEHQADCWSKAGFQRLRHRLGITPLVTWSDVGLDVRCS